MTAIEITDRLRAAVDGRFRFDAEPHTYWLGPTQLTPFSTWIKDYVEPFDEPVRAAAYARKHGTTTEAVLALWAHNRWVGTGTHVGIERFYDGVPPLPEGHEHDHPDVQHRFTKFLNIYFERLLALTPLGQEIQVWNEELGICGTIDCLAYHEPTGQAFVLDWKTNKDFSTDKNCYRKYMSGPFSDVLDNKHNQYSMQISYYRLILELMGIPTAGGALIHLPPGDAPPVRYAAIDFRQRIHHLLKTRLC